tara:strand:+ start:150 stop:335 length:186 start_codon:yes stop_codon:yes gene_type:complete
MSRSKQNGVKPIHNYNIYCGFDIDVEKWFIEIQMPKFGQGNILQWFNSKEDYDEELKKFLL